MAAGDDEVDIGDVYRAMRKHSQEKKRSNGESTRALLELYPEIEVRELNAGMHLVLRYNGRTIDFWPTTGKWIDRHHAGAHQRGVFRLLKSLGLPERQDGQAAKR